MYSKDPTVIRNFTKKGKEKTKIDILWTINALTHNMPMYLREWNLKLQHTNHSITHTLSVINVVLSYNSLIILRISEYGVVSLYIFLMIHFIGLLIHNIPKELFVCSNKNINRLGNLTCWPYVTLKLARWSFNSLCRHGARNLGIVPGPQWAVSSLRVQNKSQKSSYNSDFFLWKYRFYYCI